MSHLTEEQFEDLLRGQERVPEHVDQCPQCRARWEEKRALARRVHKAFSSIHADSDLADQIRSQTVAAQAAAVEARPRLIPLHVRQQIWSALAIAAIVLVVVLLRSSHLDTRSRVVAAQTALIGLHRVNLEALDGYRDDEGHHQPCECERRTSKSGSGVAMPCCKRGLCLRGCQEQEFLGRPVECCVIQQPNAPALSVVLVSESPEALGMTPAATTTVTGQAIWQASCGPCNMASVRMGEESCCVIGQVPPEDLVAVLNAFAE